MPFHIRVTKRKSRTERQQLYVRTDLTLEELRERFLKPYEEGAPLTIRGATVELTELEKIEVFESDEPIAVLIEQEKQEWRKSGAVNMSWEWDWLAAAKGHDRTDDFINGPPGTATHRAQPQVHAAVPATPRDPRTVFVVHGRDQQNTDALFVFLRALRLDPREFSTLLAQAGEGSPYVGDVVRRGIEEAGAVVVLLTPDDSATLVEALRRPGDAGDALTRTQARLNVAFEAGLAMTAERPRTVFVQIGDTAPFSDIIGRHAVRFDGSIERRKEVAERLRGLGCAVDTSGDHWLRVGDFQTPP